MWNGWEFYWTVLIKNSSLILMNMSQITCWEIGCSLIWVRVKRETAMRKKLENNRLPLNNFFSDQSWRRRRFSILLVWKNRKKEIFNVISQKLMVKIHLSFQSHLLCLISVKTTSKHQRKACEDSLSILFARKLGRLFGTRLWTKSMLLFIKNWNKSKESLSVTFNYIWL